LRFGADGESLEWVVMGDAGEQVLASEPGVGAFAQLRNMLLAPLVPELFL